MAERPHTPPERVALTSFVTGRYYVLGAGQTVDEIEATGEWLATDTPMDVRR